MSPIPFRDSADFEELGAAAFLKIQRDAISYQGALLLVNGRGEPLEFSYTRLDMPSTFLWRRDDIKRHAMRKLAASLLSLCPRVPRIMLCLAQEVDSELFCEDIQISLPVCRLAPQSTAVAYCDRESRAAANVPEPWNLFWFPQPPVSSSPEGKLFDRILSVGLLIEPFERAAVGLTEVFNKSGRDAK